MISIQCQSNEKIKNVINKFCAKSGCGLNSYSFIYNAKEITINDNKTIDDFRIRDKDVIIVVKKDELNKNKNTELSEGQTSSDNDSSEENKYTEFKNQNTNDNNYNQEKINLCFNTSSGSKISF